MKHVFGPVPSRRLGRVLGIDPLPSKTCNWNCVYCQLGRSAPLRNERREYVPVEELLTEARQALSAPGLPPLQGISIAGSGEPTLYSGLGRLLDGLRPLGLPVNVVTNGALLYRPEVRAELMGADAVLPTLSAGNAETFQRLHRPSAGLSFERLVEGLLAFRAEYRGRLYVEVMVVRGINDSVGALAELAEILERLRPDAIDLNSPERPPAEAWVEPPSARALARAGRQLGLAARFLARPQPLPRLETDALLALLTCHPLPEAEVLGALGDGPAAAEALRALAAQGRLHAVERGGRRFWTASAARHAGAH